VCEPQLGRLLTLTRARAPDAAAQAACTLLAQGRLTRQGGDGSRVPPSFDPAMDALAGHDCDAVGATLSRRRCAPALRCGGDGLCTRDEVAAALTGGADAFARMSLRLLAHALERDAVPDDVLRADTRRAYRVAREPPQTCADLPDDAIVRHAVCELPTQPALPDHCALAIDDEAEVVRVTPRDPAE